MRVNGDRDDPLGGHPWRPSRPRRGARGTRDARDASEIRGFRAAVLKVRIHLPPAESRLRTRLLQRRPAAFRGRHKRVRDSNAAPHSDDVRTGSTAVDADGQSEHVSRGAAASRGGGPPVLSIHFRPIGPLHRLPAP